MDFIGPFSIKHLSNNFIQTLEILLDFFFLFLLVIRLFFLSSRIFSSLFNILQGAFVIYIFFLFYWSNKMSNILLPSTLSPLFSKLNYYLSYVVRLTIFFLYWLCAPPTRRNLFTTITLNFIIHKLNNPLQIFHPHYSLLVYAYYCILFKHVIIFTYHEIIIVIKKIKNQRIILNLLFKSKSENEKMLLQEKSL